MYAEFTMNLQVSTPRIAPKLAHVRSKNTRAPLRLSYIARAEYSRSAPSPRLVRVASPTLRTSVAHPPIVAPKSFIRMYAAAEGKMFLFADLRTPQAN